jgi:hypothetical protein
MNAVISFATVGMTLQQTLTLAMCRVGNEDEDLIMCCVVTYLKEQNYTQPQTTHLLRIRKWPIWCTAGAEHGGS